MAWTPLPLMLSSWALVSLWAAYRLGGSWVDCGVAAEAGHLTRWACQALMLVVLLPLPVLDELLAQPQFEAWCRDRMAVQAWADERTVQGVHYSVSPPEPVQGLLLPVLRREHHYTDAVTQQTLVRFVSFHAHGGKVARWVGQPDAPLTFAGQCSPTDLQALLGRIPMQASGAGTGMESTLGQLPSP